MKGIKLKEIRREMGLTQEEFGNAIGISKNTISAWEFKGNLNGKAVDLINKAVETFNKTHANSEIDMIITRTINLDKDKEINNLQKENEQVKLFQSQLSKLREETIMLREENRRLSNDLIECKGEIINLLVKNK